VKVEGHTPFGPSNKGVATMTKSYVPHSGTTWPNWDFQRANNQQDGGMVGTYMHRARSANERFDNKPSVHVALPQAAATLCGISLDQAPTGHQTYGLSFAVTPTMPLNGNGCARCKNAAPDHFADAITFTIAFRKWWAQEAILALQLDVEPEREPEEPKKGKK
jgi:hypothetical protein